MELIQFEWICFVVEEIDINIVTMQWTESVVYPLPSTSSITPSSRSMSPSFLSTPLPTFHFTHSLPREIRSAFSSNQGINIKIHLWLQIFIHLIEKEIMQNFKHRNCTLLSLCIHIKWWYPPPRSHNTRAWHLLCHFRHEAKTFEKRK